ncbi:MAG TPA: SWIM zinc finger family protein [Roseiflexaceae bacterium]|nr:SWIM zinc finger family protein [Roseiflexaceae bacterium]
MHNALSADQVLALAPDPASAKAGRGLATAQSWVTLGRTDGAVWGECRGSAREPYRTQVDLGGPAFRCSCPSRKFPCKHAIGLLLLLAAQPGMLPTAAPPPWVEEWLESRARSAQRRVTQQTAPREDGPEASRRRAAAQSRTSAAREAKVAAGLEELGRWLRDQVRQGLAAAQARPASYWSAAAARLVDAQAPGMARLVRELAGVPSCGEGWQARLLERLGRLHLLAEGYRRIADLPPETQADVRAALGFTVSQEELLAAPGLRDTWLVLGQRVEEEDNLRVQRTWLWGRNTARPALVLAFAAAGQVLDKSLAPGTMLEAELCFYPGAAPLRALVRERLGPSMPLADLPATTAAEGTAAYAAALARNPWIERYPLCIGPATLARQGARWWVRDSSGRGLPLAGRFDAAWRLLALSGGQPITLFGEWDGEELRAVSAWVDAGFLALAVGSYNTTM